MANFGKTGIGGTDAGYATWLWACKYQATGSGTVTQISLYISGADGAGQGRVGIYADSAGSPGALLEESAPAVLTDGWNHFAGFTQAIVNGVNYWLAWITSRSAQHVYWDDGAVNQAKYQDLFGWSALENPWTGGTFIDREFSIYGTYTPVVSGGAVGKRGLLLTL